MLKASGSKCIMQTHRPQTILKQQGDTPEKTFTIKPNPSVSAPDSFTTLKILTLVLTVFKQNDVDTNTARQRISFLRNFIA